MRASHHLLLGHGLATQAIRAAAAAAGLRSASSQPQPVRAGHRPAEDVAAARRADGHINRWWLDPLHGRGYPADMLETYGVELPVRAGDLDAIAAPTDFLGLNYYFRQVVVDDPDGPAPFARQIAVPGVAETAMGWEVYPDGPGAPAASGSPRTTRPARIYVTENGSAWPDERRARTAQIEDKERTDYLEQHLDARARAAAARGAPVAGYFAWSLLDNFEWAYGYDKRFGLVHVDYATQRRTIKASGHRYAELIRASRRRAGANRSDVGARLVND